MRYNDILLVEDEAPMLMSYSYFIEKTYGIKPDTAYDHTGAIELAKEKHYDLCISDGLYGKWVDLHKYFKSESPDTRFVLFSGNRKELERASELDVEYYDKGPSELEKMMRELMGDL